MKYQAKVQILGSFWPRLSPIGSVLWKYHVFACRACTHSISGVGSVGEKNPEQVLYFTLLLTDT